MGSQKLSYGISENDKPIIPTNIRDLLTWPSWPFSFGGNWRWTSWLVIIQPKMGLNQSCLSICGIIITRKSDVFKLHLILSPCFLSEIRVVLFSILFFYTFLWPLGPWWLIHSRSPSRQLLKLPAESLCNGSVWGDHEFCSGYTPYIMGC